MSKGSCKQEYRQTISDEILWKKRFHHDLITSFGRHFKKYYLTAISLGIQTFKATWHFPFLGDLLQWHTFLRQPSTTSVDKIFISIILHFITCPGKKLSNDVLNKWFKISGLDNSLVSWPHHMHWRSETDNIQFYVPLTPTHSLTWSVSWWLGKGSSWDKEVLFTF